MKAQFAALTILAVLAFGPSPKQLPVDDTTPKLATGLLGEAGRQAGFALPGPQNGDAVVDDVSSGAAVTGALKSVGLEAGKKFTSGCSASSKHRPGRRVSISPAPTAVASLPAGLTRPGGRAGEPGWTPRRRRTSGGRQAAGQARRQFAFGAVKTEAA